MIYILLILPFCFFIYCWYIEPRRFQRRRIDVQLPWTLQHPLKILHLSDLHLYAGRTESIPFIHALNQLEPDLIFITGDLIENDSGIPVCIDALKPLKAKYGIYAVLGNHDYYHMSWDDIGNKTGSLPKNHTAKQNDIDRLIQELNTMGIQVLRNENRTIHINGEPLSIVGIDDPYVLQDDLKKSFSGINQEDSCLVLVHSPEKHIEIADLEIADLVFSGHTHGGQIRLPLYGALLTRTNAPRRFVSGLLKEKNTFFYTSTGIGTGPNTRPRFNCFPEAVLFHINSKND